MSNGITKVLIKKNNDLKKYRGMMKYHKIKKVEI